MKKNILYWGAIFSAILSAAALIFLLGHVPEEREIYSAIPQPDENKPYIFLIGEGRSFSLDAGDILFKQMDKDIPYRNELASLFPLLSKSESGALLIRIEEKDLKLSGSIRFNFNDLQVLSSGEIPREWAGLEGYVLKNSGDDFFQLFSPGSSKPILMKKDGGMVLISDSVSGLDEMIAILAGDLENIKFERKDKYPNHVMINDAGLLSQIGALYGLQVKPGKVVVKADWIDVEGSGELEWKISGLDEILSDQILHKIQSRKWKEYLLFPSPNIFAAGVNIPGIDENDYHILGLEKWQEDLGISPDAFREIISGPIVLNISGKSKFLLFSFPGLILQLIGRGQSGLDFVDLFWSSRWGTFKPSVDPVEGYERGGSSSLPLSLVAAANNDLAVIGFMEKELLERKEKPSVALPIMENDDQSVLWFFLDGPGLSKAFESLITASSLAEKMGSPMADKTRVIMESSRMLEKMGKVSFVMKSLEKGRIRWENVELVSRD